MQGPRRWDVFCRVIDNFGDVGVCWRLAADLAARGEHVRLWADDLAALAWMAPQGASGVQVRPWSEAEREGHGGAEPGDVVVEAFACDPPASFVATMAGRARPPVWINLEYLSAEDWVERCHALPSPQSVGPGRGLTKWFFHPGFTPATGGLLREPGLMDRRAGFEAARWRSAHGLSLREGERLAVLFCYDNPALPGLLEALADAPTLLALTPGPAQQQMRGRACPAGVRTVELPWFSQTEFDHLLWSADLNIVRGEDSLVRALWAGKPFVWQLYPQHDRVHQAKMAAFLDRWKALGGLEGSPMAAIEPALSRLWTAWNGGAPTPVPPPALPSWPAWTAAARMARAALLHQTDLVTRLIDFVHLQSRV